MDAVDAQLLTQLLDEHSAALVLYAQHWGREPEDVVQEAFLRLLHQRPVPDNPVGWLYRVVRNESISSSRKATRRARHETKATSDQEPWFTPTSDDAMDATAAKKALESLPGEQREVVLLRLWGGQSFKQIAKITGKSTSTTHRQYLAGLSALRENMEEPSA